MGYWRALNLFLAAQFLMWRSWGVNYRDWGGALKREKMVKDLD